jgi:RNA-directed DNA polymerase
VSEKTRQETATQNHQKWLWVEAAVWTVRMLAALVNGVKACPERGRRGGKWFSLMDKIYAERTLQIAWQRVRSNWGAAGIDRISVERFEGQAEQYLHELH